MSPVSDGGGSLEGRGRKGCNLGVGRLARVDANFLYPLPLLQPPTLQEDSSKQVSFLLSHRQERAFRMPKR